MVEDADVDAVQFVTLLQQPLPCLKYLMIVLTEFPYSDRYSAPGHQNFEGVSCPGHCTERAPHHRPNNWCTE